jgi:hypothetical protein
MYDSLRVALWAGAAASALAAVCLVYLLSQNSGSRNIALATGALAGAAILLCVQLRFELRADESTDFITAEFTIDRAKPEIRQWKYSITQGQRLVRDLDASGKFAAAHPGQFDGDRGKLTQDMVIFSLLAYLGVEQFDWQIKRTQFVGQSTGTQTLTMLGSRPDECTVVTKDQLRTMLLNVGNSFAEGGMFFGQQFLCLPPRSTLQVTAVGVILTNPFCEISFTLEPSGGVHYGRPASGEKPPSTAAEVADFIERSEPRLPNGEPVFERRATGIRVTVRYSAIRAQHRDMPKYQDWSKRLVSGAQNWFMGELLMEPLVKAVQELKDDHDKSRD